MKQPGENRKPARTGGGQRQARPRRISPQQQAQQTPLADSAARDQKNPVQDLRGLQSGDHWKEHARQNRELAQKVRESTVVGHTDPDHDQPDHDQPDHGH